MKRLYTEYCDIQSAAGETIINGPTLDMFDKQATPQLRLEMGYKPSASDFVFNLYNKAGTQTVGIDSSGNVTFTGTITGGIIQTAIQGTNRIVITGNTLSTYVYSSGAEKLQGIAWGQGIGSEWGDVNFYDNGVATMQFQNATVGEGWSIIPLNGAALGLGTGTLSVLCGGAWDFSFAHTVTGLSTSANTTGSGGTPAHTHSIPSLTVHS